jgi:O-antigen/teichoic acid export membrane protein
VLPLLVLAVIPFCVVLAGFPEWVLHLAYGERHAGSEMSAILSFATVAACLGFAKLPFDVGLLAMRATRSIFCIYLIPVALLLSTGVALIHAFGLIGIPLSGLLINAALFAATWFVYRRQLAASRQAGSEDSRSRPCS